MRILEAQEIEQIKPMIEVAVEQAILSPCQKSQRGAVVFKGERILGFGNNGPPSPLGCAPEVCRSICAQYAVHAEQNALISALARGNDPSRASIFHIKVDGEGQMQPSDDLSCAECSRLVLRLGLKEFLLFQSEGYVAYQALEFHNLTLIYLKENQA